MSASASRVTSKSTRWLSELERRLPELVAGGDVTALLHAQAMAQVIASRPADRQLRRKAQRLARRAESAAGKLLAAEARAPKVPRAQQAPVERSAAPPAIRTPLRRTEPPVTADERVDTPSTRRSKPSLPREDTVSPAGATNGRRPRVPYLTGGVLDGRDPLVEPVSTSSEALVQARLVTLLSLMAKGDPPVLTVGESSLRALDFRNTIKPWTNVLLYGYGRGRALRGSLILGVFRGRHRRQIKRELKRIGVELMSRGVDMDNAVTDPVPLVAYALLTESLPVSLEPASPEGMERINDLLLGANRFFHSLSEEGARLLTDAFVLAVILGEAERYADQLGVLGLTLGDETGPTGPRRRKYLVTLAGAAAAAATLFGGYVVGSRGGGHASTARTTVTERIGETRTVHDAVRVVRTRTVPITTTVVRKVVVPGASAGRHVAATTVVLTTTVEAPRAPAPAPRTTTVVPASCASAIADGRSIALLAISDFQRFAQYAKLASDAVSATTAKDATKMTAITRQTNAIGQSLSRRAQQISRLGDKFEASSARCRP